MSSEKVYGSRNSLLIVAVAWGLVAVVGVSSAFAVETAKRSVSPKPEATTVDDCVLGPGGVLQGRLLTEDRPAIKDGSKTVAGRSIRLFYGDRFVGMTKTDSRGNFALQRLHRGVVTVVAETGQGLGVRTCRLWDATTAPPGANAFLKILPSESVFRAQGFSMPAVGIRQAAIIGGIVGGAVAVPVVQNAIEKDNPAPNSPF